MAAPNREGFRSIIPYGRVLDSNGRGVPLILAAAGHGFQREERRQVDGKPGGKVGAWPERELERRPRGAGRAMEIYLEQVARSDRTMRCKIERRQWTPGVESFWSIRAQSCRRAGLDSVDGWRKVIINRSSLNDSSSSLPARKVSCREIAGT